MKKLILLALLVVSGIAKAQQLGWHKNRVEAKHGTETDGYGRYVSRGSDSNWRTRYYFNPSTKKVVTIEREVFAKNGGSTINSLYYATYETLEDKFGTPDKSNRDDTKVLWYIKKGDNRGFIKLWRYKDRYWYIVSYIYGGNDEIN